MSKPNTLLRLKVSQLLPHPNNMRRFYTKQQVEEMAASIKACNGVLEPLIVIKDAKANRYLVVDGNMRLQGAKHLGDACPPLECKEVVQDEATQALTMAAANGVRYDVDAVSEGIHYRAMQKKGLTVRDISKRTGIYEARIYHRLALADLEPEIQKLIADGKLPTSSEAAKALMRLAPALRLKLANRLAENPNTKIVTIIKACDSLANGPRGKGSKSVKRPAVELSGAEARGDGPTQGLRETLKRTCKRCNQYDALDGKAPEPAWSMVMHSADETCNGCSMKDMQSVCGSCPLVDMLRRVVGQKKVPYAKG